MNVLCMFEIGRDIITRVLRSEKGCRIRVTHVHACSDGVYTRYDTVRLDYASRHIVSIMLGTVTIMFRYLDTSTEAQMTQSQGTVWNTQLFLLSGICTVILWQDYCGKGHLRKSY